MSTDQHPTDPRAELRDRIVRKLRSVESVKQHAEDVADAVMELFPDVEVTREMHEPGLIVPVGTAFAKDATHRRFVLRTAPEPIDRLTTTN